MPAVFECSFSEVRSLVANAAKGAGVDWSIAQELAEIAITLHQNNLNGCQLILTHLEETDLIAATETCPVRQGLFLLESGMLASPSKIVFEGDISSVALFAAVIAQAKDNKFTIETTDWSATVQAGIISASGIEATTKSRFVTVKSEEAETIASEPLATRALVSDGVHKRLTQLAYQSYVPECEESRRRGAGGAD